MFLKIKKRKNEKTSQRLGEIFANNISNKGMMPKIYKGFSKLNKALAGAAQ